MVIPNKGVRAANKALALLMIEDRKQGMSYWGIGKKYNRSNVRRMCIQHCGPNKSVLTSHHKYPSHCFKKGE